MIVYADTSVLIAWFHADDVFAKRATPWIQEHVTDFVWNSVLREEVRHNLRQLEGSFGRAAWNALNAAESTGRLSLSRKSLHQLLSASDELSAEKVKTIPAETWDYY